MNQFERRPEDRRAAHAWEDAEREKGKPAVALAFETTWCPRHLEPYREGWPSGAGVAMVLLFKAFTEDARAQEMAGGDAMRLSAIAAECSPLCCFVGDDALEPIYAETGVKAPPRG